MPLCFTLDKIGPLARTAEDLETVLDAIAAEDPADPSTLPGNWTRSPAPERLRRGSLPDPRVGGGGVLPAPHLERAPSRSRGPALEDRAPGRHDDFRGRLCQRAPAPHPRDPRDGGALHGGRRD